MISEAEFEALISLLDDPDREVHRHVFNKLTSLGSPVLPRLYEAWENNRIAGLQNKLEEIIHDIQLNDTLKEFESWTQKEHPDILEGLLIISKMKYPGYNEHFINNELNRIRRAVWLAMGQYVSSIEQINIFNHVFFRDLGFRSEDSALSDPRSYFMSRVIEQRKGNPISIAILYQSIALSLRIPVYGIELPSVYCLAYLKSEKDEAQFKAGVPGSDVIFYINPMNNGLIFSREEIRKYLQSIETEALPGYFSPVSPLQSMALLLSTLQKVYLKKGLEKKAEELARFTRYLG